jgi:hypothetical protein
MATISRLSGSAILAMLTLAVGSARAEDKVEVKVVKYADLAKTVKHLKGKVVVVDFWAEW